MSERDAHGGSPPEASEPGPARTSTDPRPDAENISASAAAARKAHARATSGSPKSSGDPLDEAPPDLPPAFYPSVPLLPSSEDVAFLSGLPTPCVRQYVDPQSLPAPGTDPTDTTRDPRTPSPPVPAPVQPGLDAPLASPPPSAPRRPSPPAPAIGTKRAAPSDPSSTPPASPRPDAGAAPWHPPTAASAAPAGADAPHVEDYSVPDPFGAIWGCHRRLWTGSTALGVPLRRSDTWADGRGWRRHVRVIRGVERGAAAAPAPLRPETPQGGPAAEVEVGPGLDRPGTW